MLLDLSQMSMMRALSVGLLAAATLLSVVYAEERESGGSSSSGGGGVFDAGGKSLVDVRSMIKVRAV